MARLSHKIEVHVRMLYRLILSEEVNQRGREWIEHHRITLQYTASDG